MKAWALHQVHVIDYLISYVCLMMKVYSRPTNILALETYDIRNWLSQPEVGGGWSPLVFKFMIRSSNIM